MNHQVQRRGRSLILQAVRLFMIAGGAALLLVVLPHTAVLAVDTQAGARLFEVHCAGCHPQGGNIIRRGKTLKQAALQKNQVDTLEAIATFVTNGKNNMPAFEDRLNSAEITDVSAYVLEQAAQGWR